MAEKAKKELRVAQKSIKKVVKMEKKEKEVPLKVVKKTTNNH